MPRFTLRPLTPDRRTFLALSGAGALVAATGLPARAAPRVVPSEGNSLEGLVRRDAPVRTLYEGGEWCEGPCWLPERGALVFSDVVENRMMIVREGAEAEPYRDPADNANGSILDGQGRLVTCEHRTRRVVREENGRLVPIADEYEGRRLNSPNDVALAADGALWFTDPVFGITQENEGIPAEPEQRVNGVYRIAPDGGALELKIGSIGQPNGIVFSPDGRTLYVAETAAGIDEENGASEIVAFPVDEDGGVGDGRVFATIEEGVPDGLAMDVEGNLYAGCFDGARIYAPDGTLRGRIATDCVCVNLTFGGEGNRTLFFTEGHAVYAIDMRVAGHRFA